MGVLRLLVACWESLLVSPAVLTSSFRLVDDEVVLARLVVFWLRFGGLGALFKG